MLDDILSVQVENCVRDEMVNLRKNTLKDEDKSSLSLWRFPQTPSSPRPLLLLF